ncbi:MAG: hypothetical protein V1494_00035 [Candidatus Diapherotrites archaeon]
MAFQKQLLETKKKKKLVLPESLKDSVKGLLKAFEGIKVKREAKELTAFLLLFGGAVAGRVALQYVPSVEPIIPLAVLAGFLFGAKEGFALGSGAYVASNFFIWGLQGPWTIFQALGAGIAGALGGFRGKTGKPGKMDLIVFSVIGTIVFEFLMNASGPIMGIGVLGAFGLFSIPLYFLTSLPFTLTHIISNIGFAFAASPLLKFRRKSDEIKIVGLRRTGADGTADVRVYKFGQ